MSIEKLKEKWIEILIGIVLFMAVMMWQSLVDRFVVPRVKEQLVTEKYLREDIRDGKFVGVKREQSFAENHPIPANNLLDLEGGRYITDQKMKTLLETYEKRLQDFQNRAASQETDIAKLSRTVKQLRQQVGDLEFLTEALATNKIKVKLYISDQKADQGYIVLNKKNLTISKVITNGHDYAIDSGKGEKRLEARLESLNAPEKSDTSAIGRVYRSDYYKIFNGQNGNLDSADVLLN